MRWLVLLAVACGPKPTANHPDRGSGAPLAVTPQVVDAPPSKDECDALIAHAVALAAADQPLSVDGDQQVARSELETTYGPRCRAMPRSDYLCALSAPTLAAFGDCQATRSSSTSNSSVAPGGITPAAPRSP